MCNLYASFASKGAIRKAFELAEDHAGNVSLLPAIFPDHMAPVVRNSDAGRELVQMRWGFPPPPHVTDHLLTTVRNLASPYWCPWLKPEYRCLIPVTSFAEYAPAKPRNTPVWFALSEDRPLCAFAGIWRPWHGVRGPKADPVEGEHLLFSLLTTVANEVVKPIHPKAMPVILTSPEEYAIWLNAPTPEALRLQRPLPADRLKIIAEGARRDPVGDGG